LYIINKVQTLSNTDSFKESANKGTKAKIFTTKYKRRRIKRVPNLGSLESKEEMRASISIRVYTRLQAALYSSLNLQTLAAY